MSQDPLPRRYFAALVWVGVLVLLLCACFGGGNGSGSGGGNADGNGAAGTPGSSARTSDGGTSLPQGSSGSEGPTPTTGRSKGQVPGQGTPSNLNEPQGPAQGQPPEPARPGQPQRPAPGQPPGPAAPGQAPAAPLPGPAPAPPPGPPAANQPPVQEPVVLGWLPIGPVGRGDPTWYVALKNMNCAGDTTDPGSAQSMQDLAPLLCLGLNGDEAAWESGTRALDTITPPTADQCWDQAAYDVLRNIAAFRKQNPETPFELAARSGTACPPDLKFVEDADRNSPPAGVCEGDVIILAGTLEGLPDGTVRSVRVGTTTAPVLFRTSQPDDNYPPGDLYFLAPSPAAAGTSFDVQVSVSLADYPVDGTATFNYAAAGCGQTPGSTPGSTPKSTPGSTP